MDQFHIHLDNNQMVILIMMFNHIIFYMVQVINFNYVVVILIIIIKMVHMVNLVKINIIIFINF